MFEIERTVYQPQNNYASFRRPSFSSSARTAAMRAPFVRKRLRGASLSTVIPPTTSPEYSHELAAIAARMIYKSPLPSAADLPVYILNSAAFPDSKEISYDRLLPYVLARLPGEEELIGGKGYEVIFFAGGGEDRGDSDKKKNRPSVTWMVQAYNVLSRAMRKRLAKLYLVHERKWVRMVTEIFSTIASPKFRRKVVHCSTLSQLALQIPIEDLLIPPSAYYRDRKIEDQIFAPYATGARAFRVSEPFPIATDGSARLPRVLRETTSFILADENMKTEGLFRVNARAITLEVLKEAYDRGQKFIVWKEGRNVMNFHQWKDGFGDVSVHESDEIEGYPVLAAAGLIKMWYSDLKSPIFPEAAYQYLERNYGGQDESLTHEKIMDLIGSESQWSQVQASHRQILRMHLLPLLHAVSQHPENKMTPKALAVCFAPSLLCGSDPIRDARMCGIVSRIIEYAVGEWSNGLRELCGLNDNLLTELLKLPTAPEDREDSLEKDNARGRAGSVANHAGFQSQGIMLVDHSSSTSDEEDENDSEDEDDDARPALPPRASVDQGIPLPGAQPPRYSTIMGTSQTAVSPSRATSSQHVPTGVVQRKPTPAQSRAATNEALPTMTDLQKPETLGLDRISLDSGKAFDGGATDSTQSRSRAATIQAGSLDVAAPEIMPQRGSPNSPRSRTNTISTPGIVRKPVPEQ